LFGGLGITVMMLAVPGCDDLVTEVRNNTVVDSTLGAACVVCHNDQDNRFLRPKAQWANSRHASDSLLDVYSTVNGVSRTVNLCGPQCHTHEGFLETFDSLTVTSGQYNVIGCFTCHQPHTGTYGTWSDTTLRTLSAYTFLANDSVFNMGKSNMCVHCHQAATEAPPAAITADVTITSGFGPHHSGQADVLSGKGGHRFTSQTVSNSHVQVFNANGCLRCHYGAGQGYSFGEHTFRIQKIEGSDTTQYLANCAGATCHTDLNNFYTYIDGDYNRMDSCAKLADSLETLLKSRAFLDPGDPSGIIFLTDSVIPVNAARILYNYLLYRLDGSYGVHNPLFLERLLWESVVYFDSLPPTAGFVASIRAGCAPLTVDFTDRSLGNISARFWNFGAGEGTSTDVNPTHIYDTAGTYSISLTATGAKGADTETKQSYIVAFGTKADFWAEPLTGCDTAVVHFNNLSLGTTAWEWNFGDDSTSTERHPVHRYLTAGEFDVTLIVTDSCGKDTLIKPAYIKIASGAPVADFSAEPLTGQASLTVTFTDASAGVVTAWDWNFGDGTANSSEQSPLHTFTAAGTYTVTLKVINDCGEDIAIKTDYIVVQ
jgi:PKD repeat protein